MSISHPYPLPIALALSGQGWSLIPVFGDTVTGREKEPATAWKLHQQKRASDSDITGWLSRGWQVGIVTGRVSGMVALDFDEPALAEQFKSEHPRIAAAMLWIRTRRGQHGYLAVSRHGDAIQSSQAPGIDFQADGRYVVGLFSYIAGHEYQPMDRHAVLLQIARQLPLLSPVAGGLDAIKTFMQARSTSTEPLPDIEPPAAGERLSPLAAQFLYLNMLQRGRNNALFIASRLMHDHFYQPVDAEAALLSSYIKDIRPGESPAVREREGRASIASAFKRKRRPVREIKFRQIPNCIREEMNRRGETAALRVMDALRDQGIGAGATINQKLIYRLASDYGIGGHSVRRFFTWLTGILLPGTRPNPAGLQRLSPEQQRTNVICSGAKNRQKIFSGKKGRPEYLYIIPSDGDTANCYGLTLYKASDSLSKADFKSVKNYRAALLREPVIRRPGQYPMADWHVRDRENKAGLTGRVGKTRQTVRSYLKIAGIKSQAMYLDVLLNWKNLSSIPDWSYIDEDRIRISMAGNKYIGGIFLDIDGKRYPARREIAVNALTKKQKVILKFQQANFYWHKSMPERAPVEQMQQVQPKPMKLDIKQRTFWQQQAAPDQPAAATWLKDSPGNAPAHQTARRKWQPAKPAPVPVHNQRKYQHCMNDTYRELLSTKIHTAIPEISISTARRMVDLCQAKDIHRALAVVELRKPDNRAGYFATLIEYPRFVRQQAQQARARRDYRLKLRSKRESDGDEK